MAMGGNTGPGADANFVDVAIELASGELGLRRGLILPPLAPACRVVLPPWPWPGRAQRGSTPRSADRLQDVPAARAFG
jgi:hypothetical protein